MKKIIILFYLFSITSFSQIGSPETQEVLMAYNYLNNQKETLAYIKDNFPTLKDACNLAKSHFDKNYDIAQRNLSLKVEELYKDQFTNYTATLNTQLKSYFLANKMTKMDAQNYINLVRKRANGSIESPINKTLNEFHINEIDLFDLNNLYEVTSFIQGKKTKLSIEVPKNWKEIDGSSNSVVKAFRSNFGHGHKLISIHRIANSNKIGVFTDQMLLNSIPKNSFNIKTSKQSLNGETVNTIEYEEINATVTSNLKRKTTRFYLLKSQSIFVIACTIYAKQHENLTVLSKTSDPLFRSISASFHVSDKGKDETKRLATISN